MMGRKPEDLNDSGSLLDLGIIDSTGVLELVGFLEETYEIEVDDEELIPDNLDSINNLVKYIETKKAGAATKA
jgi:acyl carrier protein